MRVVAVCTCIRGLGRPLQAPRADRPHAPVESGSDRRNTPPGGCRMSNTQLADEAVGHRTSDITYKIAATRREREAAFRLVYETYLRAGLEQPKPHGMRVMSYHMLPTTDI